MRGQAPGVRGANRVLSESPWMADAVVVIWLERVRAERESVGEVERDQQRQVHPTGRGRRTEPLVTGSLVGMIRP